MAWTDKIELQVFDPRVIAANLFAWFEENQADALAWANARGSPVLPPVLDFYLNERTPTRFPACMLNRIRYGTDTGEDISRTEIALQFQIMLVHGDRDWLAAAAPKYAMAFESMAKNIPKTSLEENSKIVFDAGALVAIETTFDFLRTNGSQFMQSFTTQVNWICDFSNYPG